MIQVHSPGALILTETRLPPERAQSVTQQLGFGGYEATDANGFRRGILLMWNQAVVRARTIGSSEQGIHYVVEVTNSDFRWLVFYLC